MFFSQVVVDGMPFVVKLADLAKHSLFFERIHGGEFSERKKPDEESSEGPAEESSEGPAEESSEGPAEESSEGPAEESSDGPDEESSEGPAEESSKKPAEESSKTPAEEFSKRWGLKGCLELAELELDDWRELLNSLILLSYPYSDPGPVTGIKHMIAV